MTPDNAPTANSKKPKARNPVGRRGSGWLVCVAIGVLSCLLMSLVMVWCNIERMDMTYFMNALQLEVQDREALRAKLEIEKEHLLSPYELGNKAKEFGMHQARPEQIRRLTGL
ncbi:MAG: hypothetical protein PHN64_09785 [Desulfovibrionaceae bacterium]|nr:hypothetical protein [Desulfovibrionaceae bacterium]